MVQVQKQMEIESSPENFRKLLELMTAIKTGVVDGKEMFPPRDVKDIIDTVGVSRPTFYRWIDSRPDKQMMPQPNNLRLIALNLLKVQEKDLQSYFQGETTLKDLFRVRPKKATPTEVYRKYETLEEPQKIEVLALLLQERALQMGNLTLQKKNKTRHVGVFSATEVSFEENMASNLGEGLSPLMGVRLRNLLSASREKHSQRTGEDLDFDEIAEREGVLFGTYNLVAIEAAAAGQITETHGARLFAPEWNAIAVICFIPTGWRNDHPVGFSDQTFMGDIERLKRSLIGNGEPRMA